MKVLHIAQILQGGTASHMCELLTLQAQEWGPENVHILAPADQVDYLDALKHCRLDTFPSSSRSLRALAGFALAVNRAVAAVRPEIIHFHGTFAGFVGRAVTWLRRSRAPIVYCSHGWSFNMQVPEYTRALFALVERIQAAHTDAIICISRHEEETARRRGLPESRLLTIHNGIAFREPSPPWQPGEDGVLPLLFVGRDCRQKGYDVLLEAMAALTGKPVELTVIGPDPSPSDPPSVRATGWLRREELPDYYERCAALLVPSRWEGFGLVALEAMRQGRAVIASDVDGLRDLVVPGVTGMLLPPDDKDVLARELGRLDAETLRAMGLRARERYLEHFSAERMHLRTRQLYERLLRKPKHGPADLTARASPNSGR